MHVLTGLWCSWQNVTCQGMSQHPFTACMTAMLDSEHGHLLRRRHVSKLLILDGREKLEMWWVEEGYLTDLSSVLLVSPFWLISSLLRLLVETQRSGPATEPSCRQQAVV